MSALDEALRYAAAGMLIFPVDANKKPLTRARIQGRIVRSRGDRGLAREMAALRFRLGAAARTLLSSTSIESTARTVTETFKTAPDAIRARSPRRRHHRPRGGLHVIYKASKPYKNAVAIDGTAHRYSALSAATSCCRCPAMVANGLSPSSARSLLPAPAWLDCVVRKAPSTRAPLTLAPRSALAPASSDSWAQKKARNELSRACVKIVTAPCGAQDTARHRMCFYIGGLVARGDLGYEEAFDSPPRRGPRHAGPSRGDPWRDLDGRVARSIESGMARPLALSETEAWVRDFRARMRLKQAGDAPWLLSEATRAKTERKPKLRSDA